MSTPGSPAVVSSSLTRTTMREASTESTLPPRRATTVTPESIATARSMPVPTSGASERRGCHRHDLLRRHVHVIDLVGRRERELVLGAARDQVVGEFAFPPQRGIR